MLRLRACLGGSLRLRGALRASPSAFGLASAWLRLRGCSSASLPRGALRLRRLFASAASSASSRAAARLLGAPPPAAGSGSGAGRCSGDGAAIGSGIASPARQRERDRDVAGALPDPGHAAARARAPALQRRPGADVGSRDVELVADEPVVRLGVRDRRRRAPCSTSRAASRVMNARIVARLRHASGRGSAPRRAAPCAAPCARSCASARTSVRGVSTASPSVALLDLGLAVAGVAAEASASGANSPSLWPTIDSVTNTGTCLRPSWTAIVWPTISGKTVDVRDHVRTRRFVARRVHLLDSLMSRSSTNGPFFDEI